MRSTTGHRAFKATLPRQRLAGRHSPYGIASDMAQKLARTQGTSRRGLNTHSMDYHVTHQHS